MQIGIELTMRIRLGGGGTSWRFNDLTPNLEAKVMDLDSHKELLLGEIGELWFRGPTVAERYWANEEATKKAFMDEGWLKTGDVGTITGKGKLNALRRKDVSNARNLCHLDSPLRRVCEMTSRSF